MNTKEYSGCRAGVPKLWNSLSFGLRQTDIGYEQFNINTFKKQESWATAKMTSRCALYMGALKIFESPWVRPRLILPKFLGMGFFRSILWRWGQNLKFVCDPDPPTLQTDGRTVHRRTDSMQSQYRALRGKNFLFRRIVNLEIGMHIIPSHIVQSSSVATSKQEPCNRRENRAMLL